MRDLIASLQLRLIVVVAILRIKFVRIPATAVLAFALITSIMSITSNITTQTDWSEDAQQISGTIIGAQLFSTNERRTGGGSSVVYRCEPIVAYELSGLTRQSPLSWLSFPTQSSLGEACADDRLGEIVSFWIVGEGTSFVRLLEEQPHPGDKTRSLVFSSFWLLFSLCFLWLMWRKKALHETKGWH